MILAVSIFMMGCSSNQKKIEKEYDNYSYQSFYANQIGTKNLNYFASDLCVTNTTNFGLENTYADVAQGGGVFNISTNEVLYSQNMFKRLYPASTTKVLTAYIIIKDCNLNDIVTISESAAKQSEDSSTCGLKAGDHITVNDLLYGLLLHSGNDAAEALAEYHSGSVEEFALTMTKEAHKLGATKSQFKNPSGLPDKEHYTTVYDMYLIFQEVIKFDKFVEIINDKSKTAIYTDKNGKTIEKTFYNSSRYHTGSVKTPKGFNIIGGKTGTTYDAGYCLVLLSTNPSGEHIISIVFKADGAHNLYLLMNQILEKYAK